MRLPNKWRVGPKTKHSMEPAVFAWDLAKAWAKELGLKWKVSVRVGHSKHPNWWRGWAYGSKGRGKVRCMMNCVLEPIHSVDRRYTNQPMYPLWNSQEIICFLFAHEFAHIIGYDGDKAGEMACNKFGYKAVQLWRERQYEHPACII